MPQQEAQSQGAHSEACCVQGGWSRVSPCGGNEAEHVSSPDQHKTIIVGRKYCLIKKYIYICMCLKSFLSKTWIKMHIHYDNCLVIFPERTSQPQQDVSFISGSLDGISLLGVQLRPLLLSDRPRLLRTQPRQLRRTEDHLWNTHTNTDTNALP